MEQSTIAAIATPPGTGGVGIIKISGPDAIKATAQIFCPGPVPKQSKPFPVNDPSFFSPWKIHYGHIADSTQNRVYDEVIVAVMPGPRSYTREDVVEIQAHGGTVILEGIMSLLMRHGICVAQPGEFTRRAFLNGRIDLAQAEAVIDLINARCDAAVDLALDQAAGSLSGAIETVRSRLTRILAAIEAMVDFPDAVEGEVDTAALCRDIAIEALDPISSMIDAYEGGKTLREGFRVVIAGAPNVGKSSIMNRLAGTDRAIVTEHPGTTRDYIETPLPTGGIPITLVDTAGLRTDPEPVEAIGIDMARRHIHEANLVLHVLDASAAVSVEDQAFFEEIHHKAALVVLNKIDRVNKNRGTTAAETLNGRPVGDKSVAASAPAPAPPGPGGQALPVDLRVVLPESMARATVVATSAKYNIGLDALRTHIVDMAQRGYTHTPEKPVPNFRHKALLLEARDALSLAIDNLKQETDPELVSIDLRQAYDRLGEITGRTAAPDVLDDIFSRYCIGK